jgi:iduronate 2-sulfatase
LIVVTPDAEHDGQATEALVESVDLFPTLCDLSGLRVPQDLDGASFAHLLENPRGDTKPAVFHVYPRRVLLGRAVRTAGYRLVEWKIAGADPDTAIVELYDYEADPDETKNVAAERPDVVAELRAMLANEPEAKPQWRSREASTRRPGLGPRVTRGR